MSAAPVLVAPPRAECRIDLGAYRANVGLLAAALTGGAAIWAVVKANAYGHDVGRIAQEAVAAGARRLCVATLSEARELRASGIRVPLLIMGPLDAPGLRRAVDLDVAVTVVGWHMVEALAALAEDAAVASPATPHRARVHLKVDTGMGRWGVPWSDATGALDRLLAIPGVEVEGIMTHFATADDTADRSFFDLQLSRFEQVVAMARERVPRILAHAANSAATLLEPRAHFDAVRCGIATYGLDPLQRSAADHGLVPVMSLSSHVAELRELAPGDGTGYCRTFIATEPCRAAIVPIGYADGVRRALGAGVGEVVIRSERCTIVGNVSMDHVSVLVGDDVEVGDVVTVIGSQGGAAVTAEDHARWAGTINYEVTCGVAGEPRLLRTHTAS